MSYKQKGSVLIVSLVMLLLLTIVGMSAMQMTSLEERMSGNFRNHELAFQAAEAGLSQAEAFVESTAFSLTDFQTACSGSQCFKSSCDGGLCFNGTFPVSSTPVSSCELGTTKPWEDWTLWDDSTKTKTATTLTGTSTQAKYIVEYRCFTVKDATNSTADKNILAQWSLSFRVTVLATGGSSDSQVMLQSTYKKINF
jgi:type IV pilus assembly protein PilX